MKRGDIPTYVEWLKTVDTAHLRAWMLKEVKLITEGNEFAVIYEGPYPIKQENEKDDEVKRMCRIVEVPRTQRLQWFAAELERRANGGTVAEKVRL